MIEWLKALIEKYMLDRRNLHDVKAFVLSENGLEFIKHFEGYFETAYRCSGNVLTVGYGHTNRTGNSPKVELGMHITREEASKILRNDLVKFEEYVKRYVNVPIKQHEYDALVSLMFNIGPASFYSSTMLVRLNSLNREDNVNTQAVHKWKKRVTEAWKWWNKASGKKIAGLVRRREWETHLFLTGDYLNKHET